MYRTLLRIIVLLLIAAKSYSQCNSTNLTAGLPQSAAFGSVTSDNLEPWRAFDTGSGSDTTKWGSNGANGFQWVGLDFGQAFDVCTITVKWSTTAYPVEYLIKGSTDYVHWTSIKYVTNNTKSSDTIAISSTAGNFSVYEIDLVNSSNGAGYKLYDCKFYSRAANQSPDVSLTAPANGASYILGTGIPITAAASDTDGGMRKVEFYHGDTLLLADSTAPYVYTWTPTVTGTFRVWAKAYDIYGATSASDTSTITVTPAPAYMRNWLLNGNNINNSNSGTVFIGAVPTTSRGDTALKLSVNGNIYAKKLTVTQLNWADYVFDPGYKLLPLQEVETFIQQNKHLPEMPSAKQTASNGLSVGDNQALLLKKIEELTLYIIQHDKEIANLKNQLKEVRKNKK